jgi:hypothetical protein
VEDADRQLERSRGNSDDVDEERRAFFKRCAQTAAVAIPATALILTMTSKNASAQSGGGGCGGGSPQ